MEIHFNGNRVMRGLGVFFLDYGRAARNINQPNYFL